jgi:hypothetical protein
VIPVATRAYRVRVAVAAVQFSRAAERAAGRPEDASSAHAHVRRRAAGLSKLNSMHPLVGRGMRTRRGQVRSTC